MTYNVNQACKDSSTYIVQLSSLLQFIVKYNTKHFYLMEQTTIKIGGQKNQVPALKKTT